MIKVKSEDGTGIAVDRSGDGPAVILVGGGSVDRSDNAPLAALLAEYFTVYNYDRRGRGDSDLSPSSTPHSPELEFQDLQAVFEAAGGSAYLYGISSGAALALLAAAAGCPAKKVALYEPPYILEESSKPRPSTDNAKICQELADDATIMGDGRLPVDAVRDYTTPTLVLSGDAGWDWIRAAAPALAGILKNGTHCALNGQTHDVSPAVLLPKLRAFFA